MKQRFVGQLLDNTPRASYDPQPMMKLGFKFSLLLCVAFLTSCNWILKDSVVISSYGTAYGERYFAARLIEKLKTVDGTGVKDPALIKTFKEVLTEELIIEGALFSWARSRNLQFTESELQQLLSEQMDGSEGLKDNIETANPSMNLLRDTLYIQLIQKKLRNHLLSEAKPTNSELQKYFVENKLLFTKPKVQFRQVVLATEIDAQTILQSLTEKKISFEDAEKKFSLIRNFKEDREIPFFESIESGFIPQLLVSPVGLHPRVFSSPSGFHIVKVLQIKKNTTQSFDALRAQVESRYLQKKSYDLYLQWVRDHVKTRYVVIDQARLLAFKAEYQESF